VGEGVRGNVDGRLINRYNDRGWPAWDDASLGDTASRIHHVFGGHGGYGSFDAIAARVAMYIESALVGQARELNLRRGIALS